LTISGLEELSQAYQLVSKRVGPSVVHINVVSSTPSSRVDEFSWLYRWEAQGLGSGVIIDPEGYILTNYHVVRGAAEIRVALSDGREVDAKLVGKDPATDLAVLEIEAPQLVAAEWGDSDELEVGALVWAVGSPFGLQRSITCGILSAKNRAGMAGRVYQDFLQTDAAVNPGNSGGPLVDARGRVVGINTAIVGEAYQGISFAIPSSVARVVYDRLRTTGEVERGWLGVGLENVSESLARQLGLERAVGAYVVGVYSDPSRSSPARQAGIRPDDVIVRWDGVPVEDAASLSRMVARTDPSSTVEVVILRRGQELTLLVEVGRRPTDID
jgi:S1-C subfamily serine protease